MDASFPVRETLSKKERLCGKKEIENLLAKGKFGYSGSFKYCVFKGNGQPVHRILISVPKRYFKRAVKRNLLKRRIRESWRRLKHLLPPEGSCDILFVYNAKEVLSYAGIYGEIEVIVRKING